MLSAMDSKLLEGSKISSEELRALFGEVPKTIALTTRVGVNLDRGERTNTCITSTNKNEKKQNSVKLQILQHTPELLIATRSAIGVLKAVTEEPDSYIVSLAEVREAPLG